MSARRGKGRPRSRSRKKEARPRLVAKTTLEVKDWLRRCADWETKRLRSSVRQVAGDKEIIDIGQLKVTESHVIRRAVERELIRIELAGGPGITPTEDE